jgi:hypothetical protein
VEAVAAAVAVQVVMVQGYQEVLEEAVLVTVLQVEQVQLRVLLQPLVVVKAHLLVLVAVRLVKVFTQYKQLEEQVVRAVLMEQLVQMESTEIGMKQALVAVQQTQEV